MRCTVRMAGVDCEHVSTEDEACAALTARVSIVLPIMMLAVIIQQRETWIRDRRRRCVAVAELELILTRAVGELRVLNARHAAFALFDVGAARLAVLFEHLQAAVPAGGWTRRRVAEGELLFERALLGRVKLFHAGLALHP